MGGSPVFDTYPHPDEAVSSPSEIATHRPNPIALHVGTYVDRQRYLGSAKYPLCLLKRVFLSDMLVRLEHVQVKKFILANSSNKRTLRLDCFPK